MKDHKSPLFDWGHVFFVELAVVALALTIASDGPGVVFILPYFSLRFFTGFWPWPQIFGG